MRTAKIAITLDKELLAAIDLLVKQKVFANRSKAIQQAVLQEISRRKHERLIEECKKLNPELEQQLAEEGIETELDEWPKY